MPDRVKAAVEEARRSKDRWFASSQDSPLPHELRRKFAGLAYFDYDPGFRVRARLARNPAPRSVMMATSTGIEQQYHEHGRFEFELEGRRVTMNAYKRATPPGHDHGHERASLFVPFRDATSGKETYGASRYLDIDESGGSDYVIDFNLAYNPYCAYSEAYTCPLPPRENWLTVAIRAGERSFALK